MNSKDLFSHIAQKRSFLCVGLDTDINKIPPHIQGNNREKILAFNKAIIDATADLCIAYKPNLAFYESLGIEGWEALEETIRYIKEHFPDLFIIADAKRGDIGNTSEMYAKTFYDRLGADAVTIAPYMGEDSVKPFIRSGKWAIVLALTSNKGSLDFQLTLDKENRKLFENILLKTQQWGGEEEMMYVVGATRGILFQDVRKIVPNHFLLVPGVGAQGGSLEEVVKYGMNERCGLIVNASRSIIYASKGEDFALSAREEAKKVQEEMEKLLRGRGLVK